ncbi:MAG: tyrosine-type recombinase/integrase [Intestinimonas massiliensis]|uniref:tyrosine-type recombinase/integrase n=1 Tax=Intestinimonas TaxID=1392389 RepID=UPI00243253DA|nr:MULTISPECIES: tyrosine-type recombinase/integrase [Intestinimonas]MCI5563689.1 tyrosine-type recombinase/integrase [Intestinimonas massiliensis (ex Afouda et al. 2020)]MDY5338414.1 tyrosine-type recombinase/integrase [Intestinimonas sp.]
MFSSTGEQESQQKNSSYDTHLYKLCAEAGIRRFCMHALRHTYAARAIESGMRPKVLQKLPGYASIKTTMGQYVHVTDDSMSKAVLRLEQNRQIQNGTVMVQQTPL